MRRPLADAVLLVRALVPVDADGQPVAGPRRAAVADHAHVPDLVADLADPGAVVGRVAPQIRERGDQDVAGVRVTGVAVGLPHLAAVADVVTRDAVLTGERAGPDRGMRACGHGGERAGDRVAVVRALAHQRLEVGPAVGPVLQHVPAAAVDHERDDDLRWRAGGDAGQRRPRSIRRPIGEAHQGRRRRSDVGERDACRVVRRLDATGRVHDQRDALQVHPHRCVAGGAVEPHQVARLRRVVRAVVRRQHQLQLARPARVIRATHQLHVLGAQVVRHRVLDGHRIGERGERVARPSAPPTSNHAKLPRPASVRNRRRPGSGGPASALERVRQTSTPGRSPSTRVRRRWPVPCSRARRRRTPRRRRAARTGATSVGFRISRPLDSVRASRFDR